jgi:hypothetical protein
MEGTPARLLEERAIDGPAAQLVEQPVRPIRSLIVNATESPLGWLLAHGHVTPRQFEAGERLRGDWERAQLAPRVTMAWDATPVARGRGGSATGIDLNGAQLDAKARFDQAITAAGAGLSDILWRIVCAGEGMRDAETALGWPARAGKLVLRFALDRVADYYRIP